MATIYPTATSQQLVKKSLVFLIQLCREIPERCVGSEGNRQATRFFENEMAKYGWKTEARPFDAIDWLDGGATLKAGGREFPVLVSPYSLGCSEEAVMVAASGIDELERLDAKDKFVFLYGDIAREQLMPKNFVFYNPESHQKIVGLLENSGAKAIICATGRNAELAGGVYPFPLIEDGDFDIPSVYMTEEAGEELLPFVGQKVVLHSNSRRIPGKGFNVLAWKGKAGGERIVITAHIDAKKGSPGAIDNATGVVVLLLLGELLESYSGERLIEIVAFNGEDYYAVPGQMYYVNSNHGRFDNILLNINIDGAGYLEGGSAFSFYGVPEKIKDSLRSILNQRPGMSEGTPWPQGDHSIFVQFGRPALAVTSQWFSENINSQEITHTPKDNLTIVDPRRLVEIAEVIKNLVLLL